MNAISAPISNIHTHTLWCDGENTVDEMAGSAMEAGFSALGFSSHSPAPFDPLCPGIEDIDAYKADIRRAREKYAGRLYIACGIEQDYFSQNPTGGFEYFIGSVHYIKDKNGAIHTIDGAPGDALRCRDGVFGGDGDGLAEAYYALVAQNVKERRPTVVGHFDLVTKNNRDGRLFNEESPRYRAAALAAMEQVAGQLAAYGGMLEVNTRAMVRGLRDVPYPAPFLLRRARQLGVRVVITTDCHKAGTLADGYGDALQYVAAAGYDTMAVFQNGAFADVKI